MSEYRPDKSLATDWVATYLAQSKEFLESIGWKDAPGLDQVRLLEKMQLDLERQRANTAGYVNLLERRLKESAQPALVQQHEKARGELEALQFHIHHVVNALKFLSDVRQENQTERIQTTAALPVMGTLLTFLRQAWSMPTDALSSLAEIPEVLQRRWVSELKLSQPAAPALSRGLDPASASSHGTASKEIVEARAYRRGRDPRTVLLIVDEALQISDGRLIGALSGYEPEVKPGDCIVARMARTTDGTQGSVLIAAEFRSYLMMDAESSSTVKARRPGAAGKHHAVRADIAIGLAGGWESSLLIARNLEWTLIPRDVMELGMSGA